MNHLYDIALRNRRTGFRLGTEFRSFCAQSVIPDIVWNQIPTCFVPTFAERKNELAKSPQVIPNWEALDVRCKVFLDLTDGAISPKTERCREAVMEIRQIIHDVLRDFRCGCVVNSGHSDNNCPANRTEGNNSLGNN